MSNFPDYTSSCGYENGAYAEGASIYPYGAPARNQAYGHRNDADVRNPPQGINQPYHNPEISGSPVETTFLPSTSFPYDQNAIQTNVVFANKSFVDTSASHLVPGALSSHIAHPFADQMPLSTSCSYTECQGSSRRPIEQTPIPDVSLHRFMTFSSANVVSNYPHQHKVRAKDLQTYERRLRRRSWFGKFSTTEEPSIHPDDLFVRWGYVSVNAPSRFCWLMHQDQTTGLIYCRIDHKDSRGRPCMHSAKHMKDAKAHIRNYFKYRPYVCEGTNKHAPCTDRFTIPERRNDHYSKMNGPPEEKIKCRLCRTKPILRRNFRRHLKDQHQVEEI